MNKILYALLMAGIVLMFGGCATLDVTPPYKLKTVEAVLPVTVAINATGERLRDALSDPSESAMIAASGKLFEKVILLPVEMRFKPTEEIKKAYKADYILSIQLTDVNVHGDLNPIWFASIPIFFFKPLTPIITFDATASLDCTVLEVKTGSIVLQREVSASSTDHFSPVNPREKVRNLTTRSINGALAISLEELSGKISK